MRAKVSSDDGGLGPPPTDITQLRYRRLGGRTETRITGLDITNGSARHSGMAEPWATIATAALPLVIAGALGLIGQISSPAQQLRRGLSADVAFVEHVREPARGRHARDIEQRVIQLTAYTRFPGFGMEQRWYAVIAVYFYGSTLYLWLRYADGTYETTRALVATVAVLFGTRAWWFGCYRPWNVQTAARLSYLIPEVDQELQENVLSRARGTLILWEVVMLLPSSAWAYFGVVGFHGLVPVPDDWRFLVTASLAVAITAFLVFLSRRLPLNAALSDPRSATTGNADPGGSAR